MKRRDFLAVTGATSAGLLTGAWTLPWQHKPAEPLLIAGSTNVLPFTKALLPAFGKHQGGLEIITDGGGSLAGLIALKRGAIDIAAMSRELKRAEDDGQVCDHLFGKDAVAVVTAPGNPVGGITRAQVRDVLAGKITDWADLGGPAGPIDVINRAPGSTTRKWMEDNVMGGAEMARHVTLAPSAAALASAVAGNPRALGFLATRDLTGNVKPMAVNGVAIGRATIYSGRYPLTRSLYYVTRTSPAEPVRRFLDFVRSAEGQDALEPDLLRVY